MTDLGDMEQALALDALENAFACCGTVAEAQEAHERAVESGVSDEEIGEAVTRGQMTMHAVMASQPGS